MVPYIDVKKVAEEFEKREAEILSESGSQYLPVSGAMNYFRDESADFLMMAEQIRREERAYREYNRIQNTNQKHEINKIYEKISKIKGMENFSRKDVEIAFNHVFNDIYELEEGKGLFCPEYDMAQLRNRLISGKSIQEHDRILLQHERLEHYYMYEKGMSYQEAYDKTSEIYLYKPPKEDK